MAIRLPHVFLGMGLILAAGVASVLVLEARAGGASVPGVVVVEAPWLAAADLVALGGQALGGDRIVASHVQDVPAGEGPLAPFDPDFASRLGSRGDVTALFTRHPELDRATTRGAWRNVFDAFPVLAGRSSAQRLVDEAQAFVRAQTGTRAFLVAVAPDPVEDGPANPALGGLAEALAVLPSYRRSSLVVLGARSADGTRTVLRVDVGPWSGQSRADLGDLLEARW